MPAETAESAAASAAQSNAPSNAQSAAQSAAPRRRLDWRLLDWRAVDWRVVFMLFPRRRFTADELRRAVPRRANPTLVVTVAINLCLVLLLLFLFGRSGSTPGWYPLAMLGGAVTLAVAGAMAWDNPGSTTARVIYCACPLLAGLVLALGWDGPGLGRTEATALWLLVLIGTLALWFVIVHRHQYIEIRLREMDERERAVEMAQRLAAAQLAPHFLFNTLASLQHWVHTQDPRAATLLAALTGYLRATLPMFSRATHPAAQELQAVRHYLEVMQARLGARLEFDIEVEEAVQQQSLPPGLLLTLVENAVEHGIEPQLRGGRVQLRGRVHDMPAAVGQAGRAVVFTVQDSGPGPAPGFSDGIGLANCRERLALTHGTAARLDIGPAPEGGCLASLTLPLTLPLPLP